MKLLLPVSQIFEGKLAASLGLVVVWLAFFGTHKKANYAVFEYLAGCNETRIRSDL